MCVFRVLSCLVKLWKQKYFYILQLKIICSLVNNLFSPREHTNRWKYLRFSVLGERLLYQKSFTCLSKCLHRHDNEYLLYKQIYHFNSVARVNFISTCYQVNLLLLFPKTAAISNFKENKLSKLWIRKLSDRKSTIVLYVIS